MTLLALTRLPPTDGAAISGEVLFDGAPLHGPHPRISYIFQDPMASLDPVMRSGAQLREAMAWQGEHQGRAVQQGAVALILPGQLHDLRVGGHHIPKVLGSR